MKREMELRPDVAFVVAVWVEVLLYGVYLCLFFGAMTVVYRRPTTNNFRTSSRVFFFSIILMFILATIHISVGLVRLINAFFLLVDPRGPFFYLFNFKRADNFTYNIILCLMTWLGDGLVIYRCYYVWGGNYYVIALPAVLLILAVAINSMTIFWFVHPEAVSPAVLMPWLSTVYPMAFAQNIITTALISIKIWIQYRRSSASGVHDSSSTLTLSRILRIIIESAAIYTLQIFALTVMFFTNHISQIIVQSAIVPSIGIVFVLMAIRIHLAKTRPTNARTGPSTIPPWLEDGDSSLEMSHASSIQRLAARLDAEASKESEGSPTDTECSYPSSSKPLPPLLLSKPLPPLIEN